MQGETQEEQREKEEGVHTPIWFVSIQSLWAASSQALASLWIYRHPYIERDEDRLGRETLE